jgi:predicted dehydrogenase
MNPSTAVRNPDLSRLAHLPQILILRYVVGVLMGFTLGISGCGQFANTFIPVFQAHPAIDEVAIADLELERVEETAKKFDIDRTFGSHEELCESDADAVAIFIQRHLHGPVTIQALEAGKHVYSAVPIASSIDEIRQIIDLVEDTRLVYMNGETSFYYPHTIYCRERFRDSDFGEFVYGQAAYYHDMSRGFYEAFERSGGDDWKQVAGFPPMYYPTHSISSVLSVIRESVTKVSCLGWNDDHPDGIFQKGVNLWDNPFSNETALMRTSDGGMMRINEFRRIGYDGVASNEPVNIYGTEGCFEENSGCQYWTELDPEERHELTDLLKSGSEYDEDGSLEDDFYSQFSEVHPVERLPEPLHDMGTGGHNGAHPFLVDDFARAVTDEVLPPVNAWEAAKYCAPGLVAHESSKKGGEQLEVPGFGTPPDDWKQMKPAEAYLQD